MTPRRRSREAALQFLYQKDVPSLKESSDLSGEVRDYMNHFNVPRDSKNFAEELAKGTLENQEELDSIIDQAGSNWKLDRMSPVDRSLLRMSLYEMKSVGTVPSVVIDEAVEMGKTYGSEESHRFVNGILDQLAKNLTKLKNSPQPNSANT